MRSAVTFDERQAPAVRVGAEQVLHGEADSRSRLVRRLGEKDRQALASALDKVAAARRLREVATRDSLLTCVEVDGVRAVGMEIAQEGRLPTREREERYGGRNADVHPDHPGLDVMLVPAHSRTG